MGRIKLELPETFTFETEMSIRITDINYGGHLGNDSLLALIHEARVRFLAHHGFSELDAGDGAGMIQSDAVIVFKSEAFYAETVKIQVAVDNFSATGCDFIFLITEQKSKREIARAKTGIAFFDYERKKLLRVPVVFKQTVTE